MGLVVIRNEQLDGARGVVDEDSLRDWQLRGWEALGPAVSALDATTLDEAATAAVASDKALAAAAAKKAAADLAASLDTETPGQPAPVLLRGTSAASTAPSPSEKE